MIIQLTVQPNINIKDAGKLTIKDSGGNGKLNFTNGKIEIHGDSTYGDKRKEIPSTLNLVSGTITNSANATVTLWGKGATFNMTGGQVINTFQGKTDGDFAIAGNGTRKDGEDRGGIVLNISGGLVESQHDCAIYLPGVNTTTISGDAVIKGLCGIEIDSGNLTINGGTIRSTFMMAMVHGSIRK